jgi:hypothetical protein
MQTAANEASKALGPSDLPGAIAIAGMVIITAFIVVMSYTRRDGQDE